MLRQGSLQLPVRATPGAAVHDAITTGPDMRPYALPGPLSEPGRVASIAPT